MGAFEQFTLSEIVIRYPASAAVFEKYHLDFCCGGKKNLSDACREQGLALDFVQHELEQIEAENSNRNGKIEFKDMEPNLLIDYIESNHHAYVRKAVPLIQQRLVKVVKAHGQKHKELVEIAELFEDVTEEMALHMQKEEKTLFPYIREIAETVKNSGKYTRPGFVTIRNPISVMEFEHERAGTAMKNICRISGFYEPPADACTTYRLCLTELDEFERDLHKHVHLENNILFPKAVQIENILIHNN
jgi:regulator of cell morphogenesis and NO signaling